MLQKLAGLMSEHAEELALLETIDMGKPIRDATNVDVPLATECIAWYGEAIDKVYDEIAPTGPDAHVSIVREPLGVVGAVVPWNFPLLMASWKLGPALATGNSVVLKPAEQSPLTALRLAELALEAGLPDGVLQVVPGFGETAGQALGRHPDVDMIAFTGSTEVGKYFLRYSGESNMKRVALECGGKSPHIVTPRVRRPRRGRDGGRVGRLLQPGRGLQRGLAPARPLGGQGRAAREGRRGRRPYPAGRPARPQDADGRDRRRDAARPRARLHRGRQRARAPALHLGGSRVREDTGGYYVEPTIFDAVSNDMTIAREEIFGPVLSAISFDELDDAIAIANDTIYGLSAGIWTDDVNVAHRAARALRAGVVWVNTFDAGDISSPFGGFKQSGFGRDKSIHALDKFTDLKAIWIALRDRGSAARRRAARASAPCLVAVAAAGLVRVERADDDRLARVRRGHAVDEALRRRRRAAAAMADGLELVDELGAREELGHRPERLSAEVLVEPGRDHSDAALGECERGVDDRRLEELHLVDPDHVAAARPGDELRAAVDRDGRHPHACVTDDVRRVVAVVDPGLEEEHPLPGDLRAAQPADHLLALAAEHRPAHDLEPAASLRGDPDHGGILETGADGRRRGVPADGPRNR